MNTFITALLSVAIVVIIGYIAGKAKIIPEKCDSGLTIYILNFSLPILLFNTVANANLQALLEPKMNIAFVIGLFGMFVFTFLIHKFILKKSIQESAQTSYLCSYPNTAFLGIPLMLAIVGNQAMLPIVVSNIITGIIIIPITLILIEIGVIGFDNINFKKIALKIVKTPLITLSFAGLAFAVLGIKLPHLISHSFEIIGSSSSGVSLFTLGLIISRFKIFPSKIVWLNILFKNILHPLFMMIIIKLVGLDGLIAKELVILCAMPPAVSATFFSVLFGIQPEENISSTVLSTALSILTMSIFMYLVQI
ncbi:MAG: AEC family transporter [Neisseriaceae bacterium]|nr:MAG: AEC family transporter [Neisseriaceae bacterium]